MGNAVHEQQGVAGLHEQFLRGGDAFHGGAFRLHGVPGEMGMGEVGLVTAGDDHGGAVPGSDVGQGDQHVDLTAHEPAAVVPEAVAHDGRESPGMQPDRLARFPEIGEVFVDEQRAVGVVEGALPAHEMHDLFYPRRVIDQGLERRPRLVDLLQVQAVHGAVGMGVDVAVPFARRQGRNLVQAGVQFRHFRPGQGLLQVEEAPQVEQVDVQVVRFAHVVVPPAPANPVDLSVGIR